MSRLTKTDRENIVRGLIKHKFGPMEAALVEEYKIIAQGIIDTFVVLPIPESTPEHWFAKVGNFNIAGPIRGGYMDYHHTHGEVCYFIRKSNYWRYKLERKISVAYVHRDSYVTIPSDSEFVGMLEATGQKCMAFLEEKEKAEAVANKIVTRFSTGKKLIEAWPEIEPFVPVAVKSSANLPAIPVAEMNKLFKLP